METNKKASVLPKVDKAEFSKGTKSLSVLISEKVEDAEVLESPTFKPSLDETIRIIDELHTKRRHHTKLEYYANMLNSFEISQKEEDLSDKSSYYDGCNLTIKDDKRREFVLKNPTLIEEVVKFLENRFTDKRAELEAEIILPN